LKVGDNLVIAGRDAQAVVAQRRSDSVEFQLVFEADQEVTPT
jgi:hypothetical protein